MSLNNPTISQYQARNRRLKWLGFYSYQEYLNSNEWKRVRDFALKNGHGKFCEICGETKNLNIHHRRYTRIHKVSLKKQIEFLTTLCRRCHEIVHLMTNSSTNHGLHSAVRRLRKEFKKNSI